MRAKIHTNREQREFKTIGREKKEAPGQEAGENTAQSPVSLLSLNVHQRQHFPEERTQILRVYLNGKRRESLALRNFGQQKTSDRLRKRGKRKKRKIMQPLKGLAR
jgi:hypothetical protein